MKEDSNPRAVVALLNAPAWAVLRRSRDGETRRAVAALDDFFSWADGQTTFFVDITRQAVNEENSDLPKCWGLFATTHSSSPEGVLPYRIKDIRRELKARGLNALYSDLRELNY
ncbi:hypothetical protein HYZ97_02105 [Candidatus Pacearchaeota archaeon]|nr:hypothetical protein [Candidatus Pacearchaeota archaeon]